MHQPDCDELCKYAAKGVNSRSFKLGNLTGQVRQSEHGLVGLFLVLFQSHLEGFYPFNQPSNLFHSCFKHLHSLEQCLHAVWTFPVRHIVQRF